MELTLVRRDAMRPPFVDLVVDLRFDNPDPQAHWFLLGDAVGATAREVGSAGIVSVEIVPLEGGAAGRFTGDVPFTAVPIPADGEVVLRDWPLKLWDEPPVSEVEIEVVTAAGFSVGGRPAASFFEAGGVWTSDDFVELPVTLGGERRERVRLSTRPA